MRLRWIALLGVFALAPLTQAQDLNFRAVAPSRRAPLSEPIPITLSKPEPIRETPSPAPSEPRGYQPLAPIARGQIGTEITPPITIPPPPPFSGVAPPKPAVFPGGSSTSKQYGADNEMYRNGVVNNDADTKGFWARTSNMFERCWFDISGGAGGGAGGRSMFQSDHCFDCFISPVTNPHLFEDPRALTEVRPIFMWQKTPESNWIFQGKNNFYADLQARVAITQNISIVMNRLGWAWTDVANPAQGVAGGNGFSELNIGPKFTFLRNEQSQSILAAGLNFILPIGSAGPNQNTGNLSLAPYLSYAQGFGKSDYGSFNLMGTTGYSFSTDNARTDFLYSSLHLDYDIGNTHVLYPLVELNWFYYTTNGTTRNIGFEGNSMINFGSGSVNGHSDLNLALGARYRLNDHVFFGLAGEMNVLGGGRHMDLFRLTADMIIRY